MICSCNRVSWRGRDNREPLHETLLQANGTRRRTNLVLAQPRRHKRIHRLLLLRRMQRNRRPRIPTRSIYRRKRSTTQRDILLQRDNPQRTRNSPNNPRRMERRAMLRPADNPRSGLHAATRRLFHGRRTMGQQSQMRENNLTKRTTKEGRPPSFVQPFSKLENGLVFWDRSCCNLNSWLTISNCSSAAIVTRMICPSLFLW